MQIRHLPRHCCPVLDNVGNIRLSSLEYYTMSMIPCTCTSSSSASVCWPRSAKHASYITCRTYIWHGECEQKYTRADGDLFSNALQPRNWPLFISARARVLLAILLLQYRCGSYTKACSCCRNLECKFEQVAARVDIQWLRSLIDTTHVLCRMHEYKSTCQDLTDASSIVIHLPCEVSRHQYKVAQGLSSGLVYNNSLLCSLSTPSTAYYRIVFKIVLLNIFIRVALN